MWIRYVLLVCSILSAAYCLPQGRIVNGTLTYSIEKFPWLVSLRSSGGYHTCGASIIAPRWILTAAHCVYHRMHNKMTIQFASTELIANSTNTAKIKRVIIHEKFEAWDIYRIYDIALLEIFGQLVFNYKTIAPVTLPEQDFEIPQLADGVPGVLAGWGSNITGGPVQTMLHEIDLKLYSDKECMERHENKTDADNICAGADEGWRGQCFGDSGSPVIYEGHVQLGLASWSVKPCMIPPYPGVLTKVSRYINWIKEKCDSSAFRQFMTINRHANKTVHINLELAQFLIEFYKNCTNFTMFKRFVITCFFAMLFEAVSCFPDGRIVNGTSTVIEKYPFLVSLRSRTGSHSCGATIIAPRWILTAAHCVIGKIPSEMSLQFASTEVSAKSDNVLKVKRYTMHEDYRPNDAHANDIALIELYGQLVYNYKTIAPVTLPEPNFEIPQVTEGVPGVLAGWGRLETGGTLPKILQEVDLKIYSDAECNDRHGGVTTTDHICSGIDEGGKGQCNGDSGGPLLYNGSLQVGIVSWSKKPCTIYPYPGVFTKVSHYIKWIRKNMN
ncbi:transmembrane protease serine 9-like [Eurosta solidaginis]|uniref:transmembrane protease serine 9-like n=1 Tax=Eurosta solidaginis TaxID=178769 RepID=UPI0035307BCF